MSMHRLLFFVCWLILLHPPSGAPAELVMGVEDLPYLPYYALDKGEYQGFSRELFDAFAAARGHRLVYRPLPVERLYRALLNGDIDLKYPDNPAWRQELKTGQAIHYSQPVAPFVDGILVLPARGREDSGGFRRIATIRGFTPWPLLDRIKQGEVSLSENNSIPGLLQQVLTQRVDGAFINVAVARFYLQRVLGQEQALVFNTRLPHARSDYYVSTLRHSGIVQEFDAWVRESPAQVTALRRKWGIDY